MEAPSLPSYTIRQLALRNGQDRDEIWVAYQGRIYDVSRSRLWRRGNHYEHWAGQDLTTELDKDYAVHKTSVGTDSTPELLTTRGKGGEGVFP